MEKNSLWKNGESIIRILDYAEDKVFVIDCIKRNMPKWVNKADIVEYTECAEQLLWETTNKSMVDIELMDADIRRFVHKHFTFIAGVLPYVGDTKRRSEAIEQAAKEMEISKQSIRYYLCLYLAYQNISVLMPKSKSEDRDLTIDEKNMRWGLNKFFYTKNKNSLKTAYTMLLKEKYCDESGQLLPEYPSFYQFRYFYRKHRDMQTYYISRDGLKNYQRNNRPLLGNGVQEFAPNVGVGMLDATVLDIYLIDEAGNLIGRPILTICIDAYSGLCCGYSLSWEGGTYSLRGLMLNVIADKAKHCEKFGILIDKADWNCDKIPATLVTDMGSEYKSVNFEQLAEIGVTIVNLPAYRPELKGCVEKAFDLVQSYYKPYLKGKGVIEPDYQERGARDYRKDACFTLNQFEKILLHCIIYYNTKRVLENYPYTEDMLKAEIKPFSSNIWNYGLQQSGANLISITSEELIYTMLPRTQARFSRFGLKVNGLRYKHENFTEKYLSGDIAVVAYNPDDISCVWLVDDGAYIRFTLIESRFEGIDLTKAQELKSKQKTFVKGVAEDSLQAQIELANHIEAIVNSAAIRNDIDIKGIRKNREREKQRNHIDYAKEGVKHD